MDKIKLRPMREFNTEDKNYSRILFWRDSDGSAGCTVFSPGAVYPTARLHIGYILATDLTIEHLGQLVDLPAPENPVYWGDVVEWGDVSREFIVVGKSADQDWLLLQERGSINAYNVPRKIIYYNGRPVTGYIHGKRPEVQA